MDITSEVLQQLGAVNTEKGWLLTGFILESYGPGELWRVSLEPSLGSYMSHARTVTELLQLFWRAGLHVGETSKMEEIREALGIYQE